MGYNISGSWFDYPQLKQLKRSSQLITLLNTNYIPDIVSSNLSVLAHLIHARDRYCNFLDFSFK